MFPKAPANMQAERTGVNAVAEWATSNNQIWREISQADVGIDGQVELINKEGFATGKMLAVQVKSGASFFDEETNLPAPFYPDKKHRFYWESHPIPVILIVHNPNTNKSYWVDIRQELRKPSKLEKSICIPSENVLQNTAVSSLFHNAGEQGEAFISNIEGIFNTLIGTNSKNASFNVSHFDLFTFGLTNICRSIYFGVDLAIAIAERNEIPIDGEYVGIGIGEQEHDFLFDFVKFLVSQHLADVNYSDCLIDFIDREMQPSFVAPLTSRGRALVQFISNKEDEMVRNGELVNGNGLRVAQEGFFSFELHSLSGRPERIKTFCSEIKRNDQSEL